jgi:hypothetical protein
MNQNDFISNNWMNNTTNKSQDNINVNMSNDNLSYNPSPNTAIYVNNSYSREYINELKSVFENEKQQLIFKNRSLQTHIDRLKASFSEEISNLQGQVDHMNSKHSTTIRFIEDDYSFKLEKAIKEKEEENFRLSEKLNGLMDYNENLNTKVDDNLRIIQDLRQNYSEKINELQLALNKKDLELIEMKNFFDSKMDTINRTSEEEKSRIINNYDENLNKLNNGHTNSKEKLAMILSEREKDIKMILEKQQSQEKHYNELIVDLKQEVASHKENILNQ